jgi:hypothetical protein
VSSKRRGEHEATELCGTIIVKDELKGLVLKMSFKNRGVLLSLHELKITCGALMGSVLRDNHRRAKHLM